MCQLAGEICEGAGRAEQGARNLKPRAHFMASGPIYRGEDPNTRGRRRQERSAACDCGFVARWSIRSRQCTNCSMGGIECIDQLNEMTELSGYFIRAELRTAIAKLCSAAGQCTHAKQGGPPGTLFHHSSVCGRRVALKFRCGMSYGRELRTYGFGYSKRGEIIANGTGVTQMKMRERKLHHRMPFP